MSTQLTKFEIQLPQFADGTPQAAAVQQFLVNIQGLCSYIQYPATAVSMAGYYAPGTMVYGLITTAQQSTALGYLNQLSYVVVEVAKSSIVSSCSRSSATFQTASSDAASMTSSWVSVRVKITLNCFIDLTSPGHGYVPVVSACCILLSRTIWSGP